MAEIIYCDESGFSGNNLSDDGAPYFVFASLVLSYRTVAYTPRGHSRNASVVSAGNAITKQSSACGRSR